MEDSEGLQTFPAYLVATLLGTMLLGTIIYVFIFVDFNSWKGVDRILEVRITRIVVPFSVRLVERDGLFGVATSSTVAYNLAIFWGVDSAAVESAMRLPCRDITMEAARILQLGSLSEGFRTNNKPHREKTFLLEPPSLMLGRPPRSRYPLVLLMVRENCSVGPNEAVVLMTAVHIRDSMMTRPSSVVAQYLKQSSGRVCSLKQLYVASAPASEQLCVVCQARPLSRALLPCRHTCVCPSCFNQLNTCPLCRSPITSYFCVTEEDVTSHFSTNSHASVFREKFTGLFALR